jgi:alpha-N-arabinofuranosidase
MSEARITVQPDVVIDTIAPELHGHFAEHLGRCIYDGLWTDDTVAEEGPREDVLALFDGLDLPVLRWPGGCFADDYDWTDGVGPQAERPRRRNLFWDQGREQTREESNRVGTDEFLQVCEALDTEPYLAINVGTGDAGAAADWIEYCNSDADTTLADRRRENGHEDPYDVRYWGIGNENWGCGGQMSPEEYAGEYRRFHRYVESQGRRIDGPDLELIAVGFKKHEWNRRFLEHVLESPSVFGLPMDHLTLHHYYGRTMSIVEDGTDADDYDAFLADALAIESQIEQLAAAIDAVGSTDDVGVVIDEWGAWHTDAESGLEQPGTVLDAVSAAAVLDVFHRHSDVLTMANIAQLVNVLHCLVETDGADAWPRPTYRVFAAYEGHQGNEALHTDVATPVRDRGEDDDLPLVGASASTDGDETLLTVTNRDVDAAHEISVTLAGADAIECADATVLFADQAPEAVATPDTADDFAPESLAVETDGDSLHAELPPAAVATIVLG